MSQELKHLNRLIRQSERYSRWQQRVQDGWTLPYFGPRTLPSSQDIDGAINAFIVATPRPSQSEMTRALERVYESYGLSYYTTSLIQGINGLRFDWSQDTELTRSILTQLESSNDPNHRRIAESIVSTLSAPSDVQPSPADILDYKVHDLDPAFERLNFSESQELARVLLSTGTTEYRRNYIGTYDNGQPRYNNQFLASDAALIVLADIMKDSSRYRRFDIDDNLINKHLNTRLASLTPEKLTELRGYFEAARAEAQENDNEAIVRDAQEIISGIDVRINLLQRER
ncbi:MAG: hypothetical protein ACOYJ2_07850 [Rickettsiales bacterium]